ncbi:LOW QUALITY PROTEIN: Hypothetical protein PHPALM_19018 [Phytophthora palmivora]|uniref:Uncharacterized protein n=1 Tax=Phytophthora palmivora TaxID=4796 RepID=A0A2P4XIA8_9STRA|nr:LOW QUALITY PROTEIN: Hypothetical protein PHPALM_19018 [Phytophthora palmivora]
MSDDMLIKSEDSLKTPTTLKFVRREFRRWKDMDAGRVVPPSVEYVWPTTKPSNLLPTWSQTQASAIFESQVRSVATELQSRLAIELVEWATVTARLTDSQKGMKQEDTTSREGIDSILPDKDADLQGRQLIMRLRVTGLRVTHSSNGSSSDEPPEPKRLQQRPPRSYESRSDSTRPESGTPMSEDRNSSRTRMTDVPVPSVIGTSDDQSSGFQTSHGSSTDSPLVSVSRGAASHMPLSAGGLTLIAQGADVGGMVSGEGMGIQVTRTLFPVKSEPEDIDMLEEEAEVSDVKSEKQAFVHEPS